MSFGASQAARWQAYQTRAHMSAQLWFQIITIVVVTWFALTLYVVWHETAVYFPALQTHPYFWRWVFGTILNDTPVLNLFAPRLKLPIAHAWYPLPGVMDWLDSPEVYRAGFYTWFGHYLIRTALFPIGVAVIAIVWKVRNRFDAEHLRGLRLLGNRDYHRQLNGSSIARIYNGHSLGITLGSTIVPREIEYEHFLISGSPGAGKSTLIRQVLNQIQDRGQMAIVIDPDCEFTQHYYNEERHDTILNPLDARSAFWSPWLEFRDDSMDRDTQAMAASLIRGRSQNATEEFFKASSQTLIECMFQVVRNRSSSAGLLEFLSLPREEIHNALKGTRAFPLVDPGAREQGIGIIATTANALKCFDQLPPREHTQRVWSARDWATERQGWIFLSCTADGRDAIQKLQGVWLDCLVRWLMAQEIGSEQVWIVADELPSLGYQGQIETLVTRGRKRGLSCILGFQNISQLRSIYGRDGAVTLSSSPSTKAILRVDEADTAEWASHLLGSRDIARLSMTQLAGLNSFREGVNLSEQRATEYIVSPGEIQLLRPLEGYLAIAGHDRCKIKIPPFYGQRNQPAFMPRGAPAAQNTAAYNGDDC